jgi:TPR repeat protein
VELRQSADDSLEIIQWHFENGTRKVVGKKALRMEKGDFSCGPDGLTLRSRRVYVFVLLQNAVGSVNRNFQRSVDSSLVMKSTLVYVGNQLLFAGGERAVIWVRWIPTTWDEVVAEAKRTTPPSRYNEIAGLTHEKLLALAEEGNREAQLQLYWIAGEPNRLAWLCRAADQAHPDAQYRIGLLHQYGNEGVQQDPILAYMWYRLAASNGHATAAVDAERILNGLTSEQAAQAEVLVRRWWPGDCERELVSP